MTVHTIHVLLVEDNEDDALLMIREIEREGFDLDWVRVDTTNAFRWAIEKRCWDLILADYQLSGFTGVEALEIVRRAGMDVPVIIVSGAIGEETAVSIMKAGANDYLMKDNLTRLPAAVARELQEAEERRARKEADQAIRVLARLPDECPDPILRIGERGTILYANQASAPLFHAWDFLYSEEVPDLWKPYVCNILNEGKTKTIELSSSDRVYATTLVPISEGRYVNFYGRDLTAYKRIEEELRKSEEHYRRIVETAEEGIWLIDVQATVVFANRKMADLLGTTVSELQGKSILDVMDETSRAHAAEVFENPLNGARQLQDVVLFRTDGRPLWTILAISPIFDHHEKYVGSLGMVTDITDRKQLEGQFFQAQKMEAIGRLAGGVAHDFNNVLTVILGYSHLLLNSLGTGHVLRREVEEIKRAADRASGLTKQLLAFSRKQPLRQEVLDVDEIVQSMEKMLTRILGEDIVFVTKFDPGWKQVKADSGQLEQVILNLAVNSRDAMPRGGSLTIETAKRTIVPDGGSQFSSIPDGDYVLVTVTDTGCGMDPDTQTRIFEPFFTTKEPGKGTGLGLSTVYGIVRQSGGYVIAKSEVDVGTTMRIFFPVCQEQKEGADSGVELKEAPGGTETILLVEDEYSVRTLAGTVLRALGYTVIEASSGKESLRIAEDLGETGLDLLVTDVVMPGISGRELADLLRSRMSIPKVLYISGYTDDETFRYGVSMSEDLLLQKPFSPLTFAHKVRSLLDSP